MPNGDIVLREVWDVIYEHFSYFSRDSLTTLFSDTGFEDVVVAPAYNDLYLCGEARSSIKPPGRTQAGEPSATLRELVDTFDTRYQAKVAFWRDCIGNLAASGKTTVIWGAGSKGISFSNALGLDSSIEYVVDINPRKTGAFIPRTALQIVSPAFLREYRPAIVILMNAIYEPEVRAILTQLGVKAEIKLTSYDVI